MTNAETKLKLFRQAPRQQPRQSENIVNTIWRTNDYDKFKFSKFNRHVHVTQEMLQQAKEGIINPIVVNEDMVIIDGQHRLLASKKVGVPVEYIVKAGLGKKDIERMNVTQKPWSTLSHIEAFANDGQEAYIQLWNLKANYHLNVLIIASIGVNAPYESRQVSKSIKNGTYKFTNYANTVAFLEYFSRLREQAEMKKKMKSTILAVYRLFCLVSFDGERLIKKVVATGLNRQLDRKSPSQKEALKDLMDAYNQNLSDTSDKFIHYHINEKDKLVIDEASRIAGVQ